MRYRFRLISYLQGLKQIQDRAMKLRFKILAILSVLCILSCNKDAIEDASVISEPPAPANEFDEWLLENYVGPYNIDFKYRLEDKESSMNYTLVPADFKKSQQIARIVKHLCLEAYDEATGSRDFMCKYFPKMFHLVGSPAFNSNGTIVLGTAEGGLKITLYMVNYVDVSDIDMLNTFYFKTIHHEFAHILHQTIPFQTDYQDLSGKWYVQDSWLYNGNYLSQGFISSYSSKDVNEDFVEIISSYLTNDQKWWDAQCMAAGAEGGLILNRKLAMCKQYMKDSWSIDLERLRSIIQRRSAELEMLGL